MTQSEVRAEILSRQGLGFVESRREALRRMVLSQTQYAASLNCGLAARTRAKEPDYESTGLAPDGHLVKTWSLRGTLHTHLREDHALIVASVCLPRYARFRAKTKEMTGFGDADLDELERRVLAELQSESLTRGELHARVPELQRMPYPGWGGDLKGLAYRGRLSFVGTGAAQRFHALPDPDPEPVPDARKEMARRYFAGYGPATTQDLAHWLGETQSSATALVGSIREELKEVTVEGRKGPHYVWGDMVQGAGREAVLLAKFDPVILGHRDKSIFIPEGCYKRVFRLAAQVEAVVLLQGFGAGTWRLGRRSGGLTVAVEPWRTMRKREISAIEKEADRMARSMASTLFEVSFADPR